MCLMPREIINPAKRLYAGTAFKMSVPCGHCKECDYLKCQEYYFRSYYEAMSCIEHGGYVYFDTLTYAPEHLPYVSDFCDFVPEDSLVNVPCFNSRACKKFFDRLRIEIERSGTDPDGMFGYFLTCEYGLDERFTHRPHYHVLFYVRDNRMSPLDFSAHVSHAWRYGRTDGLPYQTPGYVLNHVYRQDGSDLDSVVLRSVCNYVAKYVNKDSDFMRLVDGRLRSLMLYLKDYDPERRQEMYRELRSRIYPFHRQSVGFGKSFLDYNSLDDIERTFTIRMPDKDNGFRTIPIPTYYKRKLWYDLLRNADGTLFWRLNEKGRELKYNQRYVGDCIRNLAGRFEDIYNNLSSYINCDVSHIESLRSDISTLLSGRTFRDFATYMLYYRGRVLPSSYVSNRVIDGVVECPSLDEMIELLRRGDIGKPLYYSYTTKNDKDHFGSSFVSTDFHGTYKSYYQDAAGKYYKLYSGSDCYPVPVFCRNIVISEDSDILFHGFDVLFDFFSEVTQPYNKDLQDSYLYIQSLRKLFKNFHYG